MADDPAEDVYNDPDNMLTDADADVQSDSETDVNQTDLSQTPLLPEKDLDNTDGRGNLDEVDPESHPEHDELGEHAEDMDADADKASDVVPSDEQDGTQ